MPLHLRHWSRHLCAYLSQVIASSCALCGAVGEQAVCHACRAQFFQVYTLRCVQCATPLPPQTASARCGACLTLPPAFDATIAATDYAPPGDQLILGLKFGARLALAPQFARMLHEAILRESTLPLPTQLTAVPLGAQRLAERGFNQALEIAKPLSRQLGIKLEPQLVKRQRETRAQALLHPKERQQNIQQAFTLPHHAFARVRGQHVGVIDDVMTTGKTLNELAATLKRFGATRVTNFVFARTPPK